MTIQAKLHVVEKPKYNEELRTWLEEYIKEHPHLPTPVLARENHIGASRTALDAYLNGTYFLPKENGGHGVQNGSKLESKIAAYRERVEGTVRHGYQNSFLETRSYQQFKHACHTAISENVIVVVYANPGVGKSRCLQEYSTAQLKTMPVQILCSANITTRYFVQKIAHELGLDDKTPTAKLEDLCAERLKRNPRPLFVDQANYLNEKALGTICYLWEKARIPIVLIGTKDLFELFMTSRLTQDVRAQLSSRVAMHYPLMELSVEEVKTITSRALGEHATTGAIQNLFKITNGNHRHLDMALPRVRELANRNEDALRSGDIQMEDVIAKATSKIMVG